MTYDSDAFKFNQAWRSSELPLTGLRPPWEAWPSCCILRDGGGLALSKCVPKYNTRERWTLASHVSLCKWMPSSGQSSWYFYLQLRRLRCPSKWEISLGTFSSSYSSVSDTRNSKLGESTWLMCSTGLPMYDLHLCLILESEWLYADILKWLKKF